MKNKRGFTLVELLAVIVILAVIALIATPIILNVIEEAKKGAAEQSALGYIDAVEKQIVINDMDEDTSNDIGNGTFDIKDLKVNIKGTKPTSGSVTIVKGKVETINLIIGDYSVTIDKNGKATATKKKVNYGTEIQSVYENLYTSSTPSNSLTMTDSSDEYYNGNYKFPRSLIGSLSTGSERISSYPRASESGWTNFGVVYSGTNSYEFSRESNLNRWLFIRIAPSGYTTNVYISKFKLDFSDNNSLTLSDAVNLGYIEPLVVVSSSAKDSKYIWNNTINIITGGETSSGSFPSAIIVLKVKEKSALKGYTFYTNKDWSTQYDGVDVVELKEGTEISLEPLI